MGRRVSEELLKPIQKKLENVERLEFQSGLDAEGEPAAWIWIVMKADAAEQAWSWDNRERIRALVRDELKRADVTDWIYVHFRSANEEAASASLSST